MKLSGRDFPFWAVEDRSRRYSDRYDRRFYKVSGVRPLQTKIGPKPYYDTEAYIILVGSWAKPITNMNIGSSGRIIGQSALYKMREPDIRDKQLLLRGLFGLDL